MSQLKDSQHLKISFELIEKATNNFQNCIGKGGYGRVYKGKLLISDQLTTVAVKRLDEKFGQGEKQFLTEIKLRQNHPNLISLLGFCDEGNEKIIVYEYAEGGSLDRYMNLKDNKVCILSWLKRLEICVDIARGLDHLHNRAGEHQTIIHRDLKSPNILLDCNLGAKISDFGLSKLSLAGLDTSVVCGTIGYVEPEYRITGIVTKESDVYSFGMVLLEILCGRLCTIRDGNGKLISAYYKKKNLHLIIDPNLSDQLSSDSYLRFLSIVHGCLHKDRKQRHPISQVLEELEEALQIEKSEVGKKSLLASSDDLRGWISVLPFITLVTRRTNVGKIFDIFDLNKDGGLSIKEVAAFLFVTIPGEKHLRTCIDEVFSWYHKYVDGKKGLTYHGLLQYYDDGHSDLDSDIAQLVSDSNDSNKRRKLMWLLEKLNSNKDSVLNGQQVTPPHKSLLQKIGGLPIEVFSWYRTRGLTSDSLSTKGVDDDATRNQFDLDSEVFELLLKPDGDDDALLVHPPAETEVRDEPLTTRSKIIYLLIALLIWWITMILAKLKHVLVLFLILFNSVNVFLNDRQQWRS